MKRSAYSMFSNLLWLWLINRKNNCASDTEYCMDVLHCYSQQCLEQYMSVFGGAIEKCLKLGIPLCVRVPWHFQAPADFDRLKTLNLGCSGPTVCKKLKSNGELLPLLPEQCLKYRQNSISRRWVYALEVQKPEMQAWLWWLFIKHAERTVVLGPLLKSTELRELVGLNTKMKITTLICHLTGR